MFASLQSVRDVPPTFLQTAVATDAWSVKSPRGLVLIDDDSAFRTIMRAFAQSRGIQLDAFESLQSMGSIGALGKYSVAIVDYELGKMNGVEIAQYIPSLFKELPMVLISGRSRSATQQDPWPRCIKKFVHKDCGPDAIIDEALQLLRR